MSGHDEFDPEIARLFNRPMDLADNDAFVQRMSQRLSGEWRVRTLALTLAGAIGGLAAMRQALGNSLSFQVSDAPLPRASVVDSTVREVSTDFTSLIAQLNPFAEVTAVSGMQVFWLMSLGLIAAAATLALRAVDEG